MKRNLLTALALLVVALCLQAQDKVSSNTAFIIRHPEINGEKQVKCFVEFRNGVDERVLAKYDATVRSHYANSGIVTVTMPVAKIAELAREPEIAHIAVSTMMRQTNDSAAIQTNADDVISGRTPLDHGYTGKGVVIGIIDGDIQYDHPAYWNASHTRFRIKRVWNQNESGRAPAGYSYGKEYADSAAILTRKYDNDQQGNSGHGGHVTGSAAGAQTQAGFAGMAPEADIVFVSTTFSNADIADAVQYIYDYAASVGKPCVINMSFGGNIGPHDGTGVFHQVLGSMIGNGKIMCASAGNEGVYNIHVGKSVEANDSLRAILIHTNGEFSYHDIWCDAGMSYTVRLSLLYGGDNSIVASTDLFSSADTAEESSWLRYGSSQRIKYYIGATLDPYNNKYNTYVVLDSVQISSNYYPVITVTGNARGKIDMWSYDYRSAYYSPKAPTTGSWTRSTRYGSITDLASGDEVISVGSYVSRGAGTYESQNLSAFSSAGPTADGRHKPDITAPGQIVVSAYSDNAATGARVTTMTYGGKTYYYGKYAGTSMSSPVTAGIVAQWLEAYPALTVAEVGSVLKATAIKDSYTTQNVDADLWGAGKIDAYAGILDVIGRRPLAVEDAVDVQDVRVFPNPASTTVNILFAQEQSEAEILMFNIEGRCVYARKVTSATECTIPTSGFPAGQYILRINGAPYKIIIK